MKQSSTGIADEIISMYAKYGGEAYAGEQVTQLEHMLQAAQLAREQGYGEEVILAAFLHDIGHICVSGQEAAQMDGFGTMDHEEVGAAYLRERGFSEKLIRLVESHVEAKRYLTFKKPGYYEQLSEASKKTLEYQGGRMTASEAISFEQDPLFDLIVQMRGWDEEAKKENLPLAAIDQYREMIVRHLNNQKV